MYYRNRGSARIILAGGSLLGLLVVVVIMAKMGGESAKTAGETGQDIKKTIEEKIQKPLDEHGRQISKITEGSFDVIIENVGGRKNAVIEVVCLLKQIDQGEARTLVESTPATVMAGLTKAEALKAKDALEQAGATVKLDKQRD